MTLTSNRGKGSFMKSKCYYITTCLLAWFLLAVPLTNCQDTDVELDPDENPGLTKHYQRLFNFYQKGKGNKDFNKDCKHKQTVDVKEQSADHWDWGTLETLEYLVGQRTNNVTSAEKRMQLPKLRKYLARVGYLKNPGSLLFLDKQTQTMRLSGCPENSIWRQQGEPKEDVKFQETRNTGEKLKIQSPNGLTYLHKYTCLDLGKCAHTFYVITKMLPELPLGYLIRQGANTEDSDEYGFACTAPLCRTLGCEMHNEQVDNRPYPPFKISWKLPASLYPANLTVTKENYESVKGSLKNVEIIWENKMREKKEVSVGVKDSYIDQSPDILDGFYNSVGKSWKNEKHSFLSRIIIKGASNDNNEGLYECIIEDANGVVTSPNFLNEDEYRGSAHIYVIPQWLMYLFGAALACVVVVALIILLCPKKMEHDDGTPYRADELVTPSKDGTGEPETEMTPETDPNPPATQESKTSKGNVSAKTTKAD